MDRAADVNVVRGTSVCPLSKTACNSKERDGVFLDSVLILFDMMAVALT